jgi:hypothetical protein
MRWIGLQLLRLAHIIAAIIFLLSVYFMIEGEAPAESFIQAIAFFCAYVWVIEQGKKGLRRKMLTRPQNVKMPKPPPVIMPAPEPVPQAPQKPAERRLAPPPMVEVGEAIPAASVSSLPANLRQFVEQGEKIIQADHGRS